MPMGFVEHHRVVWGDPGFLVFAESAVCCGGMSSIARRILYRSLRAWGA